MRILAFVLIAVGGLWGLLVGPFVIWLAAQSPPGGGYPPSDSNTSDSPLVWLALSASLAAFVAILCAIVWLTGRGQRALPGFVALLAVWHLFAAFIVLGVPGFVLMLAGSWVAWKHPRLVLPTA